MLFQFPTGRLDAEASSRIQTIYEALLKAQNSNALVSECVQRANLLQDRGWSQELTVMIAGFALITHEQEFCDHALNLISRHSCQPIQIGSRKLSIIPMPDNSSIS